MLEILWASVREPYNYIQFLKQLGCPEFRKSIITIPPSIIEIKLKKFLEKLLLN